MRLSKHVKPHIVFGVAALVLSGIFAGIIIGPVFLYAQSSPGSAGTPFDPAQPQAEPDPFAELGERYDPLGVFNTPQPPRNFVEQTPAERAEMEKEMEKGAAGAAARNPLMECRKQPQRERRPSKARRRRRRGRRKRTARRWRRSSPVLPDLKSISRAVSRVL